MASFLGAAARATYCQAHQGDPVCAVSLSNKDVFVIIGSSLIVVVTAIVIAMLLERFFRKSRE